MSAGVSVRVGAGDKNVVVRVDDAELIRGADGAAPDIQIGTVTTLAPGSEASAEMRRVDGVTYIDFSIPRGEKGENADTANAAIIAALLRLKEAFENGGNEGAAAILDELILDLSMLE